MFFFSCLLEHTKMDTKFLKPPVNEDSKQVLSDMDQQKWISETMDPSFNQPCAVVLVTTIHQPKTVTRMRMIYTPSNQATWGCMVWFGWLYSFIYCHLLLCRSQDQFLVCDLSPVLYIYIYFTFHTLNWLASMVWQRLDGSSPLFCTRCRCFIASLPVTSRSSITLALRHLTRQKVQ